MNFGYMDESGAPGVAAYHNDFLLVSIIVFESEESRDLAISAIEDLRASLHLPEDYEFHCSSNSTRPQNEFINLLPKLDFKFITIAIHKDDFRRTATYSRISGLIVEQLLNNCASIKLEMDSNPTLHAELRKRIKEQKITSIKIRERNSRHSRLIQVADYVANISAKRAKNTPTSKQLYSKIKRKELVYIKI